MATLPVSISAKVSENPVVETELIQAIDTLAEEMGVKYTTPLERRPIVDDIYEYTVTLEVGDEEFDRICLHRVVKEESAYRPVLTKAGVMMLPGNHQNFRATYLLSTQTDVPGIIINHSLAVYLAENDIDVWGIDLRRSSVPQCDCSNDNCSFMEDWGMETQINDVNKAMEFAREMRLQTRQEFPPLILLGASRGGRLAYACANYEAGLRGVRRNIAGIITVDIGYKFDPTTSVIYCTNYSDPGTCASMSASEAASIRYGALKSVYDSGKYYDDTATSMKTIAYLAENAPTGGSLIPGFAGYTNREMGEMLLSATYLFQPYPPQITYFHYCTGTFDATHSPTGLVFTNHSYMIDLSYNLDPVQSIRYMMDEEAVMGGIDTSYDDNLRRIRVPVLYVGGETGYGSQGIYTTTLFKSKDVTTLIVPGYGHIDLLYGNGAETAVWTPICNWILDHGPQHPPQHRDPHHPHSPSVTDV
ncbi:MAG: hypothetical protein U9N46_06000 [Euryarchaeota archaeon]|nr:hypothetical protein [Euryarchaeota archaeon]